MLRQPSAHYRPDSFAVFGTAGGGAVVGAAVVGSGVVVGGGGCSALESYIFILTANKWTNNYR